MIKMIMQWIHFILFKTLWKTLCVILSINIWNFLILHLFITQKLIEYWIYLKIWKRYGISHKNIKNINISSFIKKLKALKQSFFEIIQLLFQVFFNYEKY